MNRLFSVLAGLPPEPKVEAQVEDERSDGMSIDDMMRLLERDSSSPYALRYESMPIVMACFRKIVSRLQSMDPTVTDSDGNPVATPQWVRRPNPWWSWSDVVSQAVWSLVFDGDLFILRTRDRAGKTTSVTVVPYERVQVFRRSYSAVTPGLTYAIDGATVNPDEIVHVRYLTLPGAAVGLGVGDTMKKSYQISRYAEDALVRHFQQAAKPGIVFTTKDPLAPDALRESERILRERFSSVEEWWKPSIVPGGAAIISPQTNAQEAQYLQLSQWADARIAAQIFDIDPTLLGINLPGSQLTYNNAQDRTGNLWRDALRPPARKLEEAFGMFVAVGRRFALDESSVLLGGPQDRLNYAQQMAAVTVGGVNAFGINEIRSAAGFLPLTDEELAERQFPQIEPIVEPQGGE